jgi:hypothetical protein
MDINLLITCSIIYANVAIRSTSSQKSEEAIKISSTHRLFMIMMRERERESKCWPG